LSPKHQPFCPIEILSVTVNPGDEAPASKYKTTRDNWKIIQNLLLQLLSAMTFEKVVVLRWSVGAVGAGSLPGVAVGGARIGVLG
jgi:hypothetical protein